MQEKNYSENRGIHNEVGDLPWWMKYTFTISEAAEYFRIGENKLRNIVNTNRNADFILWNGNRPQIKKNLFSRFIDATNAV